MSKPNPNNYDTKEEYMEAVRSKLDYGFCNPMKSKFATEDEQEAEASWEDNSYSDGVTYGSNREPGM